MSTFCLKENIICHKYSFFGNHGNQTTSVLLRIYGKKRYISNSSIRFKSSSLSQCVLTCFASSLALFLEFPDTSSGLGRGLGCVLCEVDWPLSCMVALSLGCCDVSFSLSVLCICRRLKILLLTAVSHWKQKIWSRPFPR